MLFCITNHITVPNMNLVPRLDSSSESTDKSFYAGQIFAGGRPISPTRDEAAVTRSLLVNRKWEISKVPISWRAAATSTAVLRKAGQGLLYLACFKERTSTHTLDWSVCRDASPMTLKVNFSFAPMRCFCHNPPTRSFC